jgi:4'-phosphopantetheinyl transferase
MDNCWHKTQSIPILETEEIHIWLVSIPEFVSYLDFFWRFLSEEEKARADRFKFVTDRQRAIITRGILRLLIAGYLEDDPGSIQFTANSHGKPGLKNNKMKLEFNLSDSGDLALVAFVKNHDIGIDIEYTKKEIEVDDIVERFFSPSEVAKFLKLPQEQHHLAFFKGWVRKEAFIKMLGLGLSYGLDKFDVDLVSNEGSLLLEVRDENINPKNCLLVNLKVLPEYQSALAVMPKKNGLKINKFQFNKCLIKGL